MSQFCALLLTTYLVVSTTGTPIKDGEDVGLVDVVGNQKIVTGQSKYPFIVHIDISERKGIKREKYLCGGVIIGSKTVLTAAHCILNKHKPKIYVHAGIIDKELEATKGQKIKVSNMLAHKGYRDPCENNDDGKCCLAENDIAILWLENKFVFGPTVQKAKLSSNLQKPFYKQGFILGWGLNSLGRLPAMLQRGPVEVISQKECHNFNPNFKISDNMICVSAIIKRTRARPGDSGGPFVINKVVYGLSSATVFNSFCTIKTIDLYTFIPAYYEWIQQTLQNGPPKIESSCVIC